MFVGSWSPTIVTKFLSHSQSGRYKHISPTLPLWKSSQLPFRDEKHNYLFQYFPIDSCLLLERGFLLNQFAHTASEFGTYRRLDLINFK